MPSYYREFDSPRWKILQNAYRRIEWQLDGK